MVWGALHFVIVPRIAEFRPTLEQQVSRALGVTVRVGDIVARSNGLIPSLELNDVRLLDAQGRETLRLPQVLAALSARSIMGLGIEQIIVDHLNWPFGALWMGASGWRVSLYPVRIMRTAQLLIGCSHSPSW